MNAYWRKGVGRKRFRKEKEEKREKKDGERKVVLRATARITRRKGKEREAVSKATVTGAASGVTPKVVVATRTSTLTRFGARRVRKGVGTGRTAWTNTTWRHWRTAAGEHCDTLRYIGLDHSWKMTRKTREAPFEE